MYGEGCSKTCNNRHCKTPSNTCDHVTGRCPDGCISGFNGDDCLQNCPEGYYGTACSLSCEGRHCSSTSCPADGACGADCEAGWTLQSCTQECPRGKYGIGCNSVCGHCADNITCHHVTGTCPGGCQAGWKLPLCQTVCDNGTFGLNCERDCGHCKGTCDVVDGRCPLGCIEGYNGSHCSEKLSSLRDSSSVITPVTAGVIGLVAGVFVTVLLAVGLIVGLVRQGRLQWMNSAQKDEVNVRATSTQVDWNSTQPSDNYASISEQPSARNIYNNDYSTLDVEAKSDNDYDVIKNKEYENM
ncbi:scavenger receptor class F member 2-like isoform X1 [Haliotis asinina]|uniref:scavenger receptor class F member 2-like isoform X1 n=2 Tax=Haliotis asinina TaxID=109174 RepID=UPI003532176C